MAIQGGAPPQTHWRPLEYAAVFKHPSLKPRFASIMCIDELVPRSTNHTTLDCIYYQGLAHFPLSNERCM